MNFKKIQESQEFLKQFRLNFLMCANSDPQPNDNINRKKLLKEKYNLHFSNISKKQACSVLAAMELLEALEGGLFDDLISAPVVMPEQVYGISNGVSNVISNGISNKVETVNDCSTYMSKPMCESELRPIVNPMTGQAVNLRSCRWNFTNRNCEPLANDFAARERATYQYGLGQEQARLAERQRLKALNEKRYDMI